jgi:hypothetical protein
MLWSVCFVLILLASNRFGIDALDNRSSSLSVIIISESKSSIYTVNCLRVNYCVFLLLLLLLLLLRVQCTVTDFVFFFSPYFQSIASYVISTQNEASIDEIVVAEIGERRRVAHAHIVDAIDEISELLAGTSTRLTLLAPRNTTTQVAGSVNRAAAMVSGTSLLLLHDSVELSHDAPIAALLHRLATAPHRRIVCSATIARSLHCLRYRHCVCARL